MRILTLLLATACANTPAPEVDYWRGDWRLSAELPEVVHAGFIRATDEWHAATAGRVDHRVVAIVHYPELRPWESWSVTERALPERTLATTLGCAVAYDRGEWSEARAYRVGLHEIGHVLGLEHGGVAGDLMYPFISETVTGVDAAALAALGL